MVGAWRVEAFQIFVDGVLAGETFCGFQEKEKPPRVSASQGGFVGKIRFARICGYEPLADLFINSERALIARSCLARRSS